MAIDHSLLALAKPTRKKRKNRVRSRLTKDRRALEKQADVIAREIVYRRDGHRCVKCGTEKALTPSHIRPRGKCPRLTWMTANILTMCAACHLHWWHKDPVGAVDWLRFKYPGLYESLLHWERIAPKIDMHVIIKSLEFELSDRVNGEKTDKERQ